jgi:molecular chaperone DnaK (HSP70)
MTKVPIAIVALVSLALGCRGGSYASTEATGRIAYWRHSDVDVEERSPAVKEGRLVEDIGTERPAGVFDCMIHRGGEVPLAGAALLVPDEDNQAEIKLRLFRGRSRNITADTPLGTLIVDQLPPKERGVFVNVRVNVAGLIDLELRVPTEARVRFIKESTWAANNELTISVLCGREGSK